MRKIIKKITPPIRFARLAFLIFRLPLPFSSPSCMLINPFAPQYGINAVKSRLCTRSSARKPAMDGSIPGGGKYSTAFTGSRSRPHRYKAKKKSSMAPRTHKDHQYRSNLKKVDSEKEITGIE